MMKRCFLALLLLPALAQAAAPQWQIIPAESELTFTATQNNAPVSGQFKTFHGDIAVDPDDYKNGHIDIVVDINSISASYSELKDTLLTNDWFNAQAFPKAEFKAHDFEKTGANAYLAKGVLTIRDKSQPVTLTFTAKDIAPGKVEVVGSTSINRSAFGVGQGEWASTNEIKDEVVVHFKVSATKQ